MIALLLASLAAACPPAPDAEAAAADLVAQARSAVAELERRGPTDALAAEAEALAGAAEDPATPREKVGALATRFAARLERHCQLQAQRVAVGATGADRSRLAEILAGPEFRSSRGATLVLSRWLAGIWERVLELLGTAEAGRYAAGGRNVFFALLAGAILAAFVLALRRRAAIRRERPPPPLEPAGQRRSDPAESDSRAAAALRAGDAAEAVRQAFLGLLGSLERNGRIPAGRALTNRELVAWVGATWTGAATAGGIAPHPAPLPARGERERIAVAFSELARTFDRVVYGMAPPAIAEAGSYLERTREIRRQVAGGPR